MQVLSLGQQFLSWKISIKKYDFHFIVGEEESKAEDEIEGVKFMVKEKEKVKAKVKVMFKGNAVHTFSSLSEAQWLTFL